MEQKGLLHLYYGDGKGKYYGCHGPGASCAGQRTPGSDRSIFEGGFSGEVPGLEKLGAVFYRGVPGEKICVPDERRGSAPLPVHSRTPI